jgi:hypothetical protein
MAGPIAVHSTRQVGGVPPSLAGADAACRTSGVYIAYGSRSARLCIRTSGAHALIGERRVIRCDSGSAAGLLAGVYTGAVLFDLA